MIHRTVRTALLLAALVCALVASPLEANALAIDKVTGGVTLQDSAGLQAKAVVQAWEPFGVAGTPDFVPAHGQMRMWIGDTETVYDLDVVLVRNGQSMFGGYDEAGQHRMFFVLDAGQPATEADWFASVYGMRFLVWQITGGNLQVHEY